MATTTATMTIYTANCPTCGILYGIPEDYRERRQLDGQTWYCPSGHSIVYRKPELQALREQQVALRSELDIAYAAQRRITEDLSLKTKEVKRLRQRAKAGVCAECHRHFVNVERHMASKHGEAKPE